jgi:hypothetical protein
MTEIRSQDTDSLDLIWVVDPKANDQCLMKSVDPWADTGGPVHGAMDIFYGIVCRKINLKIQKITGTSEFYKNTPELFQNYILVPVILHLGPFLTFYNYN